ncbi:DUF4340 domain-containing protein [bacterium]|nr:DUF4340 domain-containing protein [bacterium]
MNRRTIIILVVLLVALAGLRFMQQRSHDNSLAQPDRVVLLPEFSMDDISRVELRGPISGELILERSGSEWKIPSSYGHLAKQAKVDELAAELVSLTGQFRSDREDVLADYGLADTTAVSLKLISTTGEESANLLLGSTQSRGGLFLCEAGSNTVYASGSNLLGIFNLWGDAREPDARGFLDMTLWTWDAAQVESFDLIHSGNGMTFTRAAPDTLTGESVWLVDGLPAKTTVVDQVLTTLMNLKGKDLLNPRENHGMADAMRNAKIRLANGEEFSLWVGNGEGENGDVPIQVAGQGAVYALYSSYPDRIFKPKDEFLK